MKRLTAPLYDQNRHNESKHFCEHCLYGYTTKDLLERHKPECKGLLKGQQEQNFQKRERTRCLSKTYHKQMKAPFVTYADFESLLRKIHGCDLPKNQEESFTVKTEMYEACGFAYTIVRIFGPVNCRGEDAVYV